MALTQCCVTGFRWDGTPKGKETTLGSSKTYVAGTNKEAAVVIVHDVFGWTLSNARLLADHYAEEADVTVYLPDFFGGEIVTPERLDPNYKGDEPFDLPGFMGRNNWGTRKEEITSFIKALKSELGFKKVGAIGFCWGGGAVVKLGAKGTGLVDSVTSAHPGLFDNADVDALGDCPVQFIAPEDDFTFTPELKEYVLKTLPTKGIDWDYQYFAGLAHGFATRGDSKNPVQKRGLERAKNVAVTWFKEYLR
ncbi:hypothetical protein H2200_000189 [Cladophialophora chaetospira]|uniref:Dienelactone hydrolase domain-containing protein n=1 Tax=Cladophialophora chaetospira TaxID=386627 RepID=A0AA38XMY4_9EURO|nr:hypothetical protein H2200_000189 [Cladophialophora chaetospira]